MISKTRHAVIVGGGLGGLAAALRLTMRGWRVTVCEQDSVLGGKMSRWQSQGFRFDTGPSLITLPWIFEDLFAAAGADMREHLELAPLEPLARYVYADGVRFDYTTSMPGLLPILRDCEGSADGFFRFMRLGAQIYALSKGTFLRRPVTAPPDRTVLSALRHAPLLRGWGNYHKTVCAYFRSPQLRQLFGRYPTYVGSSPYQTPATLAIIPYIEFAFGGWYVQGGLYRIVETLVGLLDERGAELRTNARVARIDAPSNSVQGIELENGDRLAADLVIMNGDTSSSPGLLGGTVTKLPAADRSLSGLVLLVGINRRVADLHHHNVFFSRDYAEEFRQLFIERRIPDDPTVYVNVPSQSDPSSAPQGGEALFLMINAPATGEQWDGPRIAEARNRVFNRLRASGFPDIEGHIVVEHAVTPQMLAERFGMPGGAIYGPHSHGWRKTFFRPPNKDKHVRGLYYAGGSAHPGGGTPMVLLSAKITEELIARYEE